MRQAWRVTMHRWLFVGLALMAAVGGVGTALVSGQRVKHPSIGLELIAMSEETSFNGFVVENVQGGRPFARATIPDREELLERMKTAEQLVQEHTDRLKEIVDEYGWPSKRLVGFDGAHAAFMLLMQSNDTGFRAQALSLMQRLPKGQVDGDDLAITTDRVALDQGKPQVYGTQVECDFRDGTIAIRNGLVDEDNVDERRAELGLPPLELDFSDARAKFGACVANGELPPLDEAD